MGKIIEGGEIDAVINASQKVEGSDVNQQNVHKKHCSHNMWGHWMGKRADKVEATIWKNP